MMYLHTILAHSSEPRLKGALNGIYEIYRHTEPRQRKGRKRTEKGDCRCPHSPSPNKSKREALHNRRSGHGNLPARNS
jgi:hypothetical protein